MEKKLRIDTATTNSKHFSLHVSLGWKALIMNNESWTSALGLFVIDIIIN